MNKKTKIHNKESGCTTKPALQKIKGKEGAKRVIPVLYCLTHKKYVCRCGKEWGKH